MKDNNNISFLDFNAVLFDNGTVIKYDTDNNIPIYYDSHHLTAWGAEWIYKKIKKNNDYNWLIGLIKRHDDVANNVGKSVGTAY